MKPEPWPSWVRTALLILLLTACSEGTRTAAPLEVEQARGGVSAAAVELADVVSVEVAGDSGGYRLSVGIESPDEGCHRYANWWEVVSEGGELLYRRILGHSHITEQPFVRSGGPVAIDAESTVVVRAHMHPGGYGGVAYSGSVADGFEPSELPEGFASQLAERQPLPQSCAH